MKICLVSSVYPLDHHDSEVPWLRQTVNLVNGEKDLDVTVFAAAFNGLEDQEIDGVKVKRFRYFPSRYETLTHKDGAPHKIQNIWYRLLSIPYIISGTVQLACFHRREKFDVLHVHWPFPHGIMAFFAKLFYPAKVVLNYHGTSLILIKRYPFVRYFQRFFIKHSDEIISNSTYTDSMVREVLDRETRVIPYGTTVETPMQTTKQQFHIISVGRLIERKGFPYLIKAMPGILEQWPEAVLTIVGGGGQFEELNSLVRSLGLEKSVNLRGKISHDELKDVYEKGSIFVLPAIFDANGETEGLGVVLIEAIENGCALIASSVGGITDVVIHEKTGLLVSETNSGEITQAVDRYFSDTNLKKKMARQAQNHVKKNFSWDKVKESICNIYRDLQA